MTPECGPETRGGDIALSVHQDLFDTIHNIINMVGNLLGMATLSNGTITLPWLANLASIDGSSGGTAPGSGLFRLLRDPRAKQFKHTKASGGTGLLDLIAVMLLTQTDANGQTRLERAATSGSLAGTLARWGITAPTAAALAGTTPPGDFEALLSLPNGQGMQIEILEGFEKNELGVISISGLPATVSASWSWPPGSPALINASMSNITGSIDFSSLPAFPGGMISGATIGSAGDVQFGLLLPNILLSATLSCSATAAGGALLGAAAGIACALAPWTCPFVIVLGTVILTILEQITEVEVNATNVGFSVDVQYQWDSTNSMVNPFVTMTPTSGSLILTSSWTGVLAPFIDNFFEVLGDAFNIWLDVLAKILPGVLQNFLRNSGFGFPPGTSALIASSGEAESVPGSMLTLSASVQLASGTANVPYSTQVDVPQNIAPNLQNTLVLLRNSVNAAPSGGAPAPGIGPGVGIALNIATYLAIAASQNVLNYYIFQQWQANQFSVTINDPATIDAVLASAAPIFAGMPPPDTIKLWPAVAPRVEVSMESIVLGMQSVATGNAPPSPPFRPLTAFFDDVRACFSSGDSDAIEFSFNFKTSATVNLSWPAIFQLFLDDAATPSQATDFDLFFSGAPKEMTTIPFASLQTLANSLAAQIIDELSASAITAPAASDRAVWPRPMPNVQQDIVQPPQGIQGANPGDAFQLDILGQRRILYMFTELNTPLLELIDTSGGQPDIAPYLSLPLTKTVNLASLTDTPPGSSTSQGVILREVWGTIFNKEYFIPPN
jgi:hypothetical protein